MDIKQAYEQFCETYKDKLIDPVVFPAMTKYLVKLFKYNHAIMNPEPKQEETPTS